MELLWPRELTGRTHICRQPTKLHRRRAKTKMMVWSIETASISNYSQASSAVDTKKRLLSLMTRTQQRWHSEAQQTGRLKQAWQNPKTETQETQTHTAKSRTSFRLKCLTRQIIRNTNPFPRRQLTWTTLTITARCNLRVVSQTTNLNSVFRHLNLFAKTTQITMHTIKSWAISLHLLGPRLKLQPMLPRRKTLHLKEGQLFMTAWSRVM